MRATTTRLAAGMAVLTIGLAATACGHTTTAKPATPKPAASKPGTPKPATSKPATSKPATSKPATSKPTDCRTHSLVWTLVLLPAKSGSGPHTARLTAANKGPGPCVFAGYPDVQIHNGKADSLEATGPGHPRPLTLDKGAKATVDLRYTPSGTHGAADYCVTEPTALVAAPHAPDTDRTDVPVTTPTHHRTHLTACGDTITMSTPRTA
ncbi:DUF4232 domain-containing protein [Streptomyces sp. NPDC048664]|uniref:DUF4232 domain-containing protein n=1 Tax=Streptomyces sp. NPDC048664 TaxID=3154505 RepID=UPI0034491C84